MRLARKQTRGLSCFSAAHGSGCRPGQPARQHQHQKLASDHEVNALGDRRSSAGPSSAQLMFRAPSKHAGIGPSARCSKLAAAASGPRPSRHRPAPPAPTWANEAKGACLSTRFCACTPSDSRAAARILLAAAGRAPVPSNQPPEVLMGRVGRRWGRGALEPAWRVDRPSSKRWEGRWATGGGGNRC